MKIILYIILVTILLSFYSCENSTISHSNPLSYGSEKPYFLFNPFIQYFELDNRINYGIINEFGKSIDSTYLRATFYDNNLFRDAGNLYMNDVNIKKQSADDIFDIRQLVDGFIDFGMAYYSSINKVVFSNDLKINTSGDVIPSMDLNYPNLDTTLIVVNKEDLETISKKLNHRLITNDIGYDNSRIRIYNESKEYLFYATFKNEVTISSESLQSIPNGNYKIECLKGYYRIDTLSNNEPLIVNIYSSFIFDTKIID